MQQSQAADTAIATCVLYSASKVAAEVIATFGPVRNMVVETATGHSLHKITRRLPKAPSCFYDHQTAWP